MGAYVKPTENAQLFAACGMVPMSGTERAYCPACGMARELTTRGRPRRLVPKYELSVRSGVRAVVHMVRVHGWVLQPKERKT